jgi:hypothetical protein
MFEVVTPSITKTQLEMSIRPEFPPESRREAVPVPPLVPVMRICEPVMILGEAVAVVVQNPRISPEKAALEAQIPAPPLMVKEPV